MACVGCARRRKKLKAQAQKVADRLRQARLSKAKQRAANSVVV